MSNSNGTIETDIGASVISDNNTESSSSASSSTSGGGDGGDDTATSVSAAITPPNTVDLELSGGGEDAWTSSKQLAVDEANYISEESFQNRTTSQAGGRKVRGGGSVRSLFNQLDKNGNGKLEKKELARALKKLGYNNNQIKALIKRYDTNKDGRLNLKEFTKMIKSNKSIGRKTRGGSRKGGSRKGGSRKGGSRKGGRRVGGTRKGGRRVGGSRKVRGGRSVRA